jgi:spermidine/putrescine-binding protein
VTLPELESNAPGRYQLTGAGNRPSLQQALKAWLSPGQEHFDKDVWLPDSRSYSRADVQAARRTGISVVEPYSDYAGTNLPGTHQFRAVTDSKGTMVVVMIVARSVAAPERLAEARQVLDWLWNPQVQAAVSQATRWISVNPAAPELDATSALLRYAWTRQAVIPVTDETP